MPATNLKRSLSMLALVTIAAGSVLGGWLAESPFWFQLTGAGSALLFPILGVILVPVGLAFAELTTMLPFSSAVDVWSTIAFGEKVGWATQWVYFLAQITEPPLVAFIFATIAGHFTAISPAESTGIAVIIILLWYLVSNFSIELTGHLSIVFFFTMIALTIVADGSFYVSGHWHMANITLHGGFFPFGVAGAIAGAAALVLKFIGFGMTPTLIEETRFSTRHISIVMALGILIPMVVYFFAAFAIAGMAPHGVIAGLKMPEPDLVHLAKMPAIFGILAIIAGALYALTTLMGFWAASARVLYGSSQLHQLPPWFLKTNRHGQPYIANVVVLLFSVFFALFTSTNWIQYIYSLAVVGAGLEYFMVCLDAYVLRDKHPEWARPYKLAYGKPLFLFGMLVSFAIFVVGVTLLPANAVPPIIIYIILGILIYFGMAYYRRHVATDYQPIVLTPLDKKGIGVVE